MSHKHARQRIEQAADGILGAAEHAALQAHLVTCAECQAYAAELANLEAALSTALQAHWPQQDMGPAAVNQLVEKVQRSAGGGTSSGWWRNKPTITLGLIGLLLLLLALLASFLGFNPFSSSGADDTTATQPAVAASATQPAVAASATATPSPSSTITMTPSPTELVLIAVPVQNVNCREGAGSSQFDIADTLYEGEAYTPLARGFDNLWVQFRGPVTEELCWVYVENLDLLINDQMVEIADIPEDLLPFAAYPPTPTPSLTPTFTPEPSQTPTPTCTPRSPTTGAQNC